VSRRRLDPDTFFYPLDAIGHWNRLYGPRGFTQYQCVLPEEAGRGAARRFLELLTKRGGASMLCVIKDCGPEGRGLLSFPRRGISIALDIPVRDGTQALVDALNERVIAEGGRVYLAKDRFTRPEHYRAMEPRLAEWTAIRRKWDPQGRLRSAQSVRLLGDRP
jgi:FAD/FMN-containing dehydrogenase